MRKKVLIVHDSLGVGGSEKSLRTIIELFKDKVIIDLVIIGAKDTKSVIPSVNNIQFVDYLWRKKINTTLKGLLQVSLIRKVRYFLEKLILRCITYFNIDIFNNRKEYDLVVAYTSDIVAKYVLFETNSARKVCYYHQGYIEVFDTSLMCRFELIACVSDGIKEELINAYPLLKDKFRTIYNYIEVDYSDFRFQSKQFREDVEFWNILSVSRLSYEKGLDLAIEAFRILVYEYNVSNFKWTILGEGIEFKKLKKQIFEFKLSERIDLFGYNVNPVKYYNCSDLFLQPSRVESYGLATIDALIFGCPVLATNTIGSFDIIGGSNFGVLCDIDARSMANELRNILAGSYKFDRYPINLIIDQNYRTLEEWTNIFQLNS